MVYLYPTQLLRALWMAPMKLEEGATVQKGQPGGVWAPRSIYWYYIAVFQVHYVHA